ncbi:hypothetical protein NXF25_012004 [Crotalus adamanteus]|uniref:Uncharacterized protein n=1 Tax=Crotalus adamanteus TaxID=8729 RepID=A0AAW1BGR9_CROAD
MNVSIRVSLKFQQKKLLKMTVSQALCHSVSVNGLLQQHQVKPSHQRRDLLIKLQYIFLMTSQFHQSLSFESQIYLELD